MKTNTILFLFLFSCIGTLAHAKDRFNDPQLDKLCNSCEDSIYSSHAMQSVEEFMQNATKKNNLDAMAEAHVQKVYLYALQLNRTDSAAYWLDEMKRKFPDKKNQLFRAIRYLIYGYQDEGKMNLALFEAQNMLKISKEKREIVEAYLGVAESYKAIENHVKAYENSKLAINFIKEHYQEVAGYKYALLCVYAAQTGIKTKQQAKALYYLHQADSVYQSDKDKKPKAESLSGFYLNFLWYASALYYMQVQDYSNVEHYLSLLKKENNDDSYRLYYSVLVEYLPKKRQYHHALVATDSLRSIKERMGINPYTPEYYKNRADILCGMEHLDDAVGTYKAYITLSDSLKILNAERSTEEFSQILQVDRLELDKKVLGLKLQTQRLRDSYYLAGFLCVVILLGLGWSIHLKRMNMRLRRTQEKLTQAYARVEKAMEVKDIFIQNMTHEIRTPLSNIIGFAHILSAMYSDHPESNEYIKIIEKNSKQMLKLVADILDISNLESRCMQIQKVLLNDICQEVVSIASQLLPPNVKLHYTPENRDLSIHTDPANLQRLLINVLGNATKFTSAGSIKLHTYLKGETVHITVTDTGIGIPADKAEWVFERFAKIDLFIPGSGLGLSISRLIATCLGGKINVDTTYQQGCCIKIELPLNGKA